MSYMSMPASGKPIDNDFHPVDSDLSATNDHWGTQMAGEIKDGPLGGTGETTQAVDYALGKKQDPKVKSIGMDTLKGWAGRKK